MTQILQAKKECKDPQTYALIGAGMEVHKQLGAGFLEAVYQEAFEKELNNREIPFKRELELPVFYKNVKLKTGYRADFICFGNVLVECKALARLSTVEDAQIIIDLS